MNKPVEGNDSVCSVAVLSTATQLSSSLYEKLPCLSLKQSAGGFFSIELQAKIKKVNSNANNKRVDTKVIIKGS
jgi:hypothetical protein